MRLSKGQATVIVLLNIIIAALVAIVLFVPQIAPGISFGQPDGSGGGDKNTGGENPPVEQPHNKYRTATQGKTDKILRETGLMGSGDETVSAVYERGGMSYIFGNATVADLDFDSYGGFICLVNAAGAIIKYEYFDGNITAVGVVGSGYAAAVYDRTTGNGKLYFVDYSGDIEEVAQPVGEPIDVFSVDNNKIAVVTQPLTTSFKLTEYSVVRGGQWTAGRSTRIDSGYTLKYFDCYDFGGTYVIAARAHSLPRYDSAVFYSFTIGGDASAYYYGGANENITRPYAVMPYPSGYFALASKNGVATIITVDYAFTSYRSVSLGFVAVDARLFFCGGKYYASFDRADGAVTYRIDDDMSRTSLPALDGIFIDTVTDCGDIFMTGVTATLSGSKREFKSASFVVLDRGTTVDLSMENCVFYGAFKNTDGYTCVISATGGDALSTPSGGRDIYVVTFAID